MNPLQKRILVNDFQYRLIAGNFLYLLSIILVFLVALVGPTATVLADDTISIGQREIAAHQLLAFHERAWFAIPMLLALCVFHSALVSHRIAGPLVRFKQIYADVAGGDLSMNFRIRRNDYLRKEAEMVAGMVARLGDRVEAIRSGHHEATATLPLLMDAAGRGAHDEVRALAGRLGTQMDSLGSGIRQFRIRENGRNALPERERDPSLRLVPTT